jgi:hypothetical protein
MTYFHVDRVQYPSGQDGFHASVLLGGYAARLDRNALSGKRIGLYGPGWRAQRLSDEAAALYERVKGELKALGASTSIKATLNAWLQAGGKE